LGLAVANPTARLYHGAAIGARTIFVAVGGAIGMGLESLSCELRGAVGLRARANSPAGRLLTSELTNRTVTGIPPPPGVARFGL